MGICFCLTDQQMGKSGSSSSTDIKEVEEVEGRIDAPLSWTAMCVSRKSNQNLNHDQNQDQGESICKLNPNSFTHESAVILLNGINLQYPRGYDTSKWLTCYSRLLKHHIDGIIITFDGTNITYDGIIITLFSIFIHITIDCTFITFNGTWYQHHI
jgi:hypothetical protein